MPVGQGRRWHQTLKNRILLENYYLPGDLELKIADFVSHYNYLRYHESIANLTRFFITPTRAANTHPSSSEG